MASLLRQAAAARQRRRHAAAQQQGAAAGGRPHRLRLRRRRGRRRSATRRSSPATRCAPRSRRCPSRPSASPAAAAPLRLLVVGGSLGAQVLNESLPQALALLTPRERPQVTHQTGAAAARRGARRLRGRPAADAEVLPFIDDMAAAPGRLRPDRLPRRRDHGQRAVRRRRRRACWCRWSSAPPRTSATTPRGMAAARRGDPPAAGRADAEQAGRPAARA